eukprot:GHVU01211934.1.p1 GENE.GHVU01211934.1~~GHVU01211934.1.p1  ORF type:complete len:440 (+),score=45.04 GHVU01211934.1:632-1951(+)
MSVEVLLCVGVNTFARVTIFAGVSICFMLYTYQHMYIYYMLSCTVHAYIHIEYEFPYLIYRVRFYSSGALRKLVLKLVASGLLSSKLKMVCDDLDVPFREPVLDVENRWNTMLGMIQYGMDSRPALDELLNRLTNKHKGYSGIDCCKPKEAAEMRLRPADWKLLQSFQELLEPFQRATLILQKATYPTAGLTIPMLATVIKEVETVKQKAPFGRPEFGAFCDHALIKLREYRELTLTEYGKIAALLDPRCRRLLGQCGVPAADQDALLVRVWSENYGEESLVETPAPASHQSPTHYFATLGVVANTGVATVEEEVGKWLSEPPTTDYESDAFSSYMRGIKAVYPRIHRMARDFLAAPGTSISCESAFSRAGITTSKRRARLDDDAIRSVVELQAWTHVPVPPPSGVLATSRSATGGRGAPVDSVSTVTSVGDSGNARGE